MRIDFMSMIAIAAGGLAKTGDTATAYVLLEFGNDVRLLARGEDTLEEFNRVYVGRDHEPFDIDVMLPPPPEPAP